MIDKHQDQKGGVGEQPPIAAQFVHIPSIADAKDMPEGGRPMRLDPRVLNRIQNAVSVLEQDYMEILSGQVSEIQQLTASVETGSWSDLEQIYELAHDIRGVAQTFSRPIAGAIAESLCTYVDNLDVDATTETTVIRDHVNALSQMAALTPEPNGAMADTVLSRVEASRMNATKRTRPVSGTAPL